MCVCHVLPQLPDVWRAVHYREADTDSPAAEPQGPVPEPEGCAQSPRQQHAAGTAPTYTIHMACLAHTPLL